ncbi:MAG: YebC/PmpR family DNA-binding transcriptional regulator [Bacteroidales bacterium]|nr:YebC/PmpR family DNA-binding transcriptional regulator [Bacteroidales bacterium]
MGRAFEYRKAAKMKRWGKMSTLFPKLSKAITIAAKEGGTDPDMNSKLRTAIINAKAGNMPKDNIDRAINRQKSEIIQQKLFSQVNIEEPNQGKLFLNFKVLLKKLFKNQNL